MDGPVAHAAAPPHGYGAQSDGGLNPNTLGFTLLIAVVATVISGTAPAVLAARADLNEMLKEGGRSGTFGRHSHRLRSVLVFAEVGLATVALIGAGLFFRSMAQL